MNVVTHRIIIEDSSLNSGLAREIHLEEELKIFRGAQQPLVEREVYFISIVYPFKFYYGFRFKRQIGIEWQIRYEQAQKKHFSEVPDSFEEIF